MFFKFKKIFFQGLIIFLLSLGLFSCRQKGDDFPFKTQLDEGWQIFSSSEAGSEGDVISSQGFKPKK